MISRRILILMAWVLGLFATSTLSAQSPPTSPTGGTAVVAGNGLMKVSWKDNANNEDVYAVYRFLNGSVTGSPLSVVASNVTSATVGDLTPGDTYQFVVFAFRWNTDPNGSPINSPTGTVTAPIVVPEYLLKTGGAGRAGTPLTLTLEPTNPSRVTSCTATGPSWLTFDATSRLFSGTPPAAGRYAVAVTAKYSNGFTLKSTYTIRVLPAVSGPVVVTNFTIPALALARGTHVLDFSNHVRDPDTTQAVHVQTNVGGFDVVLFPEATPATTTNFTAYVNGPAASRYDGTIFHRHASGFVLQGGGYFPAGGTNFTKVAARAPVANEPGFPNKRGTVAMAKLGGNPNSATCEWFVNLSDNNASNLDFQNGGFTVFGRIPDSGLQVIDAITALPVGSYTTTTVGGQAATDLMKELPVNAASAPTDMDQSLLVTIQSVRPTVLVKYSLADVGNPAVVVPTLDGSKISLQPVAEGTTNVRVLATDLDGNVLTVDMPVTVVGDADSDGIPDDEDHLNGQPPVLPVSGWVNTTFFAPAGTSAFEVRGLPPGLSLNKTTGRLTGRPTKAGAYTVQMRVKVGKVFRPWQTWTFTVQALPDSAVGSFSGLVFRHETINNSLGGTFNITVMSTGVCSGAVRLGPLSYSFRGVLETALGQNPVLGVDIPRSGKSTLRFEAAFGADHYVIGVVKDGDANVAAAGFRKIWDSAKAPLPAERRGTFNTVMPGKDLPASLVGVDPATIPYPAGTGYLVIKTDAGGGFTANGKAADGTILSCAGAVGPAGEMLCFLPYTGYTGSLLGSPKVLADGHVDGSLSWFRKPLVSRLYPAGWGAAGAEVAVNCLGARYTIPPAGTRLAAYQLPAGSPNMSVIFDGAGLDKSATNPAMNATVADNLAVTLPKLGLANPSGLTCSFNLSAGSFRGSFTLTDPDPLKPGKNYPRTVSFEGLVVPSRVSETGYIGGGFFLLPALGDPTAIPPTTHTTSPIYSGPATLWPYSPPPSS